MSSQHCIESDLIIFSSARWDKNFERIHELMTRFASQRRVFFFEKPHQLENINPFLDFHYHDSIAVITPHLPARLSTPHKTEISRALLDELMIDEDLEDYHLWYHDPSAYKFSDHLAPRLMIYDGFQNTGDQESDKERALMNRADLILNSEPRSQAQEESWDQIWQRIADLERQSLHKKAQSAKILLSQY